MRFIWLSYLELKPNKAIVQNLLASREGEWERAMFIKVGFSTSAGLFYSYPGAAAVLQTDGEI